VTGVQTCALPIC